MESKEEYWTNDCWTAAVLGVMDIPLRRCEVERDPTRPRATRVRWIFANDGNVAWLNATEFHASDAFVLPVQRLRKSYRWMSKMGNAARAQGLPDGRTQQPDAERHN